MREVLQRSSQHKHGNASKSVFCASCESSTVANAAHLQKEFPVHELTLRSPQTY
jgi:hypothetical protein